MYVSAQIGKSKRLIQSWLNRWVTSIIKGSPLTIPFLCLFTVPIFSARKIHLGVIGWISAAIRSTWDGGYTSWATVAPQRKIWMLKGETEKLSVSFKSQLISSVETPYAQAKLIVSSLMLIWHIIHSSFLFISTPTTHESFHVGLLYTDWWYMLTYLTLMAKLWNRYWYPCLFMRKLFWGVK